MIIRMTSIASAKPALSVNAAHQIENDAVRDLVCEAIIGAMIEESLAAACASDGFVTHDGYAALVGGK